MTTALILTIVGTGIGLLLGEFLVTIFCPQQTLDCVEANNPPIYRTSNDGLPFALKPGSSGILARSEFQVPVAINATGYRDHDFPPKRNEDLRIIAMGDSFTFGYGCRAEESYPQIMENVLQKKLGGSVEIVNAGFAAGYYPDTYYLYLKKIGLSLQADWYIVGFFIGNDIDHNLVEENHWLVVDENGLPEKIVNTMSTVRSGYWTSRVVPLRYRLPVIRHSHLAHLILSRFSSGQRKNISIYTGITGEVPRKMFNYWVYRKKYEERTENAVRKIEHLFQEMKKMTDARNVHLLVVMIPALEQVHPDLYHFEKYIGTKNIDIDKPQRIFSEFFQKTGIEYLDLLPAFREEGRTEMLYYPEDMHWNPRGHKLAGTILADYLLERLQERR